MKRTSPASPQSRFRNSFVVAFGSGILGALGVSLLMGFSIWMQWSSVSLEMLWGSLWTGKIVAATWATGFILHLFLGGIFAIGYAFIFKSLGRSSALLGGAIAFPHWIVSGFLISLAYVWIPNFRDHESVGITRFNETTGYFWSLHDSGTFFGSLLLHVIYGAIVGWSYSAGNRREASLDHSQTETERKPVRRSA